MKTLYIIISCFIAACGTKPQGDTSSGNKETDTAESSIARIDLPPPYATKSALNPANVIGWPDEKTPIAPSGFTVTKYAGDLDNPRWIYVLPNGDVLVAEAKKSHAAITAIDVVTGRNKEARRTGNASRISLFRDTNKDGTPDVRTIFLEGLNRPFGMLLLNNYFYVANSDELWRFPYKDNETSISSEGQKLVDIPDGGRHWTRSLIANTEGTKLYIAVGSASNVAENGMDAEFHRACILECNPDGTGLRVYADGLRNPVGMAWAPGTNILWTVVNERDELGDELVPDYLTSVQDGGFYGWPYSYFGQHLDPRITGSNQRPDLVKRAIVPDVPLGSHVAALGLCFYELKKFPEKYQGGAFIGMHGSWNSSVLVGYKVVFVPFKDGNPSEPPEDFLTGFIANDAKEQVYGRPVGVTTMPDGSMLVADDAGNTIWRVEYGAK